MTSRFLYFDCFAGASGDMIVGALLDMGVDQTRLAAGLASLPLQGYEITASPVRRGGIAATKFDVVITGKQPARTIREIRRIVDESHLPPRVKSGSLRVFERLAAAEARVHGVPLEEVHFHEVGAVDSIVDVVGAFICLELSGAEVFQASPIRVGFGTVRAAHGDLPIPAPGTAELLKGMPIYAGDKAGEFTTPTGAAILGAVCTFDPMPRTAIRAVGYGAGSRDPEGLPNVLRVIAGDLHESQETRATKTSTGADANETAIVIETNLDDMNPQAFGFIFARAFEIGALDVFTSPAQMKKDRPGVLLTVLAKPETAGLIMDLLLRETTTLGVRYYEVNRRTLARSIETVRIEQGQVRIKVARQGDKVFHFQPEYDDCVRLAAQSGRPLLEIQESAAAAYRALRLESGRLQDGETKLR